MISSSQEVRHMTKQEIGAILLDLREKAGKSREEVAELLGKSVKTVGHWETGYSQPDANTIFLLCTIYGADLNTPFGFPAKEKPTPENGDGLSAKEKTLLGLIRCLSDDQKDFLLAQLKTLTGQGK